MRIKIQFLLLSEAFLLSIIAHIGKSFVIRKNTEHKKCNFLFLLNQLQKTRRRTDEWFNEQREQRFTLTNFFV